jgi:hypothetical protein
MTDSTEGLTGAAPSPGEPERKPLPLSRDELRKHGLVDAPIDGLPPFAWRGGLYHPALGRC